MLLKRSRGKEDAVEGARPWGALRFAGGAHVDVLAAVEAERAARARASRPDSEASASPIDDAVARRAPVHARHDALADADTVAAVRALTAEVAELRAMLIHFGAARLLHPSVAAYQHRLIAAGVEESVAFGLVRSLPEPSPGHTPTAAELRAALEQKIVAALRTSADALPEAGVLAFVGPSGAGKTATLAKLAGGAALAGRRTAIITTDGERLGAASQLDAFCAIAGIDCTLALSPEALARALAGRDGADLVLIDTPGLGVRDVAGLRRLRDLLAAARPAAVHLVLSAASKASDALGAVRAFADVGVTDLAFTRLDETVTPGSLLTVAAGATLPLSFVGTGAEVPADIQPASGRDLARRILATAVRGAAAGEPSEASKPVRGAAAGEPSQ